MGNAKFCYQNYIVDEDTTCTVSSGGEDPFYPVSNLKHPHALKTFRSSSSATSILVFDMQSAVTCDTFLAVGSSIGALDLTAVTIEANATDVWSAPAFSTTVSDFDYVENFATKVFSAAQTYRYWRLTLVGTSGYVEVGKLFLGSAVQLESNNITFGFEFGRNDISDIQKGRYGQRFIDEITTVKTFKGAIGLMTQAEQTSVQAIWDYCGTSKPLWFVPDPDETFIANKDRLSGYYYFKDQPAFVNDFFSLYSTEFQLEEAK